MDNGSDSYRRYLAGDDSGLAELIVTYRDGLILYLNGFVNDLNTAEDLAEDVFFRLAVRKPRFRERSSFKTWLYAIGRNEALQYLRRERVVSVPPEALSGEEDPSAGAEEALIRSQDRLALHRCLRRLKSEYHQVLYLYYFEEFSAKEIAAVMKKSVHNIETLLYRARNAVKRELEAEGFDDENL